MALQMAHTTAHGIDLPAAYVRVVSYNGDINNINCTVTIHADQTARNNNDRQVSSEQITLTPPTGAVGADLITWCYVQLKSQARFTAAADV